ncbi:hypothetical protein CLU80_4824 [Pseudomonas sp. 29]|uniref:hypothetical protein n=1 Tax=Pseudomonas sp. 29 TaxID=2035197 RepID=UPI000C19553D|nr:hypothetical protein [Pseudomonas sp. 29]PIF52351.1 hypothetical protein CLU80_4824 [Pseudomonas sp. 29]
MDYPISVPSIGLVNGKFVNEDAVAGTPGSLIPAEWGNAVTEELLNVIKAVGQVPAEADLTQLLKAIKGIVQSASTNYAADTGTAGVYKAAFTPAITALSDGLVVRIKVKTANTGASTFAPDGVAAKPIVGSAHAPLQGGELAANGYAWLQYNSSVAAGSWVLVACSGGAFQVGNASQSSQATTLGQTLGGGAATLAAPVRAVGQTYNNLTGRPLWVCVYVGSGSGNGTTGSGYALSVGGVVICGMLGPAGSGQNISGSVTAIVPPGASYVLNNAGNGSGFVSKWSEY